jgi:hypothetical protein
MSRPPRPPSAGSVSNARVIRATQSECGAASSSVKQSTSPLALSMPRL